MQHEHENNYHGTNDLFDTGLLQPISVQRLTTQKLKMFTIKFCLVFILKFNCMVNFQNYF